jgi:hypothetical protein
MKTLTQMVKLKKINHKGDFQIGLFFGFDENLKAKAKSIGARWSQTNRCWYMLYNKENYRQILLNFDEVEIVKDENNERRTEPALIGHENVHIAEVISEFRPRTSGIEHKDSDPEFVSKIVFKGNTGKYWILAVPYKAGITPNTDWRSVIVKSSLPRLA